VRRRSLVVGAALLGLYLVTLALTVGLRSDHVRPLYDGFAPPPSYRWVDPPAFFASGNVEPKPVTTTIKLGRDGSEPAGIATPDGQFVLNLGRGAVRPSFGAASVTVKVTPVTPSALPAVPSGLRPNGNVYRVEMTYETGKKVTRLARAGNVVMEIPELGNGIFFGRHLHGHSSDPWTKLPSRAVPPRQLSVTTFIEDPGYYLAATTLPELVAPAGESSSHAVVIGAATAALAALVLVVGFVLLRRRRRVNAP
jgi:MYXO-CTERM domain-containing protein